MTTYQQATRTHKERMLADCEHTAKVAMMAIHNRLGITVELGVLYDTLLSASNAMERAAQCDLDKIQLSTRQIGIMDLVIAELSVKIGFGYYYRDKDGKRVFHMSFNFDWTHTGRGGHNGYFVDVTHTF